MSITPDDMKAIALAIAVANGHPAPAEYADKAATAFAGEPVPQVTTDAATDAEITELASPATQQ